MLELDVFALAGFGVLAQAVGMAPVQGLQAMEEMGAAAVVELVSHLTFIGGGFVAMLAGFGLEGVFWAMVAAGVGWTILTPLGALNTSRFLDQVEVHPLPFAPLSRRIVLAARREVLGPLPGEMASRIKTLLDDMVVGPTQARFAFLKTGFRVL